MSGEIELISDGESLVLSSDPSDIEEFLAAQALPVAKPAPSGLRKLLGTAGAVAQAGGEVSANSGRWLKMTKESAEKVKAAGGLTPTKIKNISHAMIGKPGDMKSWIQVVQGPGTKLTNPAVLTNVGAMMTQMAMQQAIDEIKEYLAVIDEKVDDVLAPRRTRCLPS